MAGDLARLNTYVSSCGHLLQCLVLKNLLFSVYVFDVPQSQVSINVIMLGTNAVRWLQWVVGSAPIIGSTSSQSSLASWERYVRAPASQTVYPQSVIPSYTRGNVTNPNGLLCTACGVTTLTREAPPEPPLWPKGTTVNASSYRLKGAIAGQARNCHPRNAIDGYSTTFWEADMPCIFPNILTVVVLEMMDLPGITILSSGNGLARDLVIEVLQTNGSWTRVAAVTNHTAARIQVPFVRATQAYGVRLIITQDESSSSKECIRINEVWPGIFEDPPAPPSVVVDFGMPVVGFLSISFAGASSNRPGIRLAFSEMTEYLTDVSDFTRSYNVGLTTDAHDKELNS